MTPAQQLFDHVFLPDDDLSVKDYKVAFLREVKVSRLRLKSGEAVIQSMEHYIADIHVVDCDLNSDDELRMLLLKSTAFFEILNAPDIRIFKEGIKMDEYSEAVCGLINYAEGKYSFQLSKGRSRIILAIVNMLWLSNIIEKYPSFSNLLIAHRENQYQRMQECPFRGEIRSTINDLIYNGKQRLGDNELVFVSTLDKIIKQYHDHCNNDQVGVSARLQHKAKRLVAFLDSNYANPKIDASMVAQELSMSLKSLQRLAKSLFGLGIREQIIKHRMTYAVKFLAIDKRSVKEVASLTGYTTAAYFSRAFKKFWKIAPSELVSQRNLH